MKNYWLDNYTIEGAIQSLVEWMAIWTDGYTFASDSAILDLWENFFHDYPNFLVFEPEIDMDWDTIYHKDGTVSFKNIKIDIAE